MFYVPETDKFLSHPLIKKDLIVRREYQENIFVNCLNHNALVIIPTGLGKTIVAIMLAVHRLVEKPGSKVVFLAPTKPLVNQHYKSFLDLTEILPDELKSITGSTSPQERLEVWQTLKIAFMTPQTLQNDIILNLYSLKDVSLLIFDECHRAVGDYAYCFIAKKYMEHAINPQILGLTASPGSTEEKINEIKQNLFVDHIEIRTDKDVDVRPYVQKVDNEWIRIKLPKEFIEIITILSNKLKEIYKYLKEKGLLNTQDINKVKRNDILQLDQVITKRIASSASDKEKYDMFYAKKLVANAIRISHMSELVETQDVNALKEYFDKNDIKISKNNANKSLRELFANADIKRVRNLTQELINKGIVHPKMEKLKELLHEQLKDNDISRILVFCQYRDSVNNIVSYFEEDPLVKAHKFVGQQTKEKDKGLSQKQQIALLEEFKEGLYNTLIGTSVAEEGLDIAECDLVIFYDVVPSAIRSIQRRGRTGRKKEGKVYVLMAEGTRDEGYYWAEKAKERNMSTSLKKIKELERTGNSQDSGQRNLLSYVELEKKKEKIEKEVDDCNHNEEAREEENDKGHDNFVDEKYNENEGAIVIVCDSRETSSSVVRNLSLMGVGIRLEQIKVADYVISERAAIERKTAQDFTDSIKDGRLFRELIDLRNSYERPILVLEGDIFASLSINENALYGALTSIILNLGITVYQTKDAQDTAKFLFQLAKKEQSESKSGMKLKFEKAPVKTSQLLEYVVASLPGVNATRAKNLLKELKTLESIFTADIGDLMKAEKVGKKIAETIYKLSRFKYQDDNGREL